MAVNLEALTTVGKVKNFILVQISSFISRPNKNQEIKFNEITAILKSLKLINIKEALYFH